MLASTTAVWSGAFAADGRRYSPPRMIFTEPSRDHPSRGFGYLRGVAVVVDLGEVTDLDTIFGRDGEPLTALIIAYEVAHHVQHANRATVTGVARELEADCAAGWWLSRTDVRPRIDLDRQLPRMIEALDMLKNRRLRTTETAFAASHGSSLARVAAIRAGLVAADVAACGAGVTPARP